MDQEKINAILAPVTVKKSRTQERKVRDQFWPKFKSFASHLPFAEEVAAGFYCATDTKTPTKVKATLFAALAYFIMPIDLVPDILAFVGFSDDIAVLTAALSMVRNHITDEHRTKAKLALQDASTPDITPDFTPDITED